MNIEPLPRTFYERPTVVVARELLGKVLVRQIEGEILSGRIVETEAYRGRDDPASHAHWGKTMRNSVMFGEGGLAYVYFVYGQNFCLNVTTERIGIPGAVLIRAIEPLLGLDAMIGNRFLTSEKIWNVTNGPGKLCNAMKITRELNGTDLTLRGVLQICQSDFHYPFKIRATSRVGIKKARRRLWRFYVYGNSFVSRV